MVLRSGGINYRYGYQGAYAENDGETDWNAFELKMYDFRIARWLTTDPAGQYDSPYIGMGGDPVNGVDKDGGTDDCPTCPPLPTVTVYAYRNISNVVNISHLDGIPINVVQNQDRLIKVDIPAPPAISQTPQYDNATRARIAQRAWDYNASHGINPNTGQPYVTYPEWVDNASENVVRRMLTILGVWDGVLAGRDIVMWGTKKAAKGGINAAKTGGEALVQANRTAGNLFRDDLAAALRAEGRTVNTEVFKRTPFGKRYMDLDVWHNGVNLGGIETKVGGSRYLPLQRLKRCLAWGKWLSCAIG